MFYFRIVNSSNDDNANFGKLSILTGQIVD